MKALPEKKKSIFRSFRVIACLALLAVALSACGKEKGGVCEMFWGGKGACEAKEPLSCTFWGSNCPKKAAPACDLWGTNCPDKKKDCSFYGCPAVPDVE